MSQTNDNNESSGLETLRKGLNRGDIKKIKDKLGLSRQTIWRALNGKPFNEEVLKLALEIREDNLRKVAELNDQISQL
jgi:hypothetical protein